MYLSGSRWVSFSNDPKKKPPEGRCHVEAHSQGFLPNKDSCCCAPPDGRGCWILCWNPRLRCFTPRPHPVFRQSRKRALSSRFLRLRWRQVGHPRLPGIHVPGHRLQQAVLRGHHGASGLVRSEAGGSWRGGGGTGRGRKGIHLQRRSPRKRVNKGASEPEGTPKG